MQKATFPGRIHKKQPKSLQINENRRESQKHIKSHETQKPES